MDQFLIDEIIENAKVLADIDLIDTSKDKILELYFEEARDFILDYCKVNEIPSTLYSILSKMIVFQYRQKGLENIQSEGKGSLSEAYLTEYPPNIMNRLSRHARVKFL